MTTGLDELVDNDDETLKALGVVLNAWEEACDHGIAPERIAYAALFTALTDLVASYGEEAVVDLIKRLAPRVQNGEFTLAATLH
ncbi:MAG: hypothetical protein AAFV26_07860 [Pseudomonadota bacterium]